MRISKSEIAVGLLSAVLSAAAIVWCTMTAAERTAVLQRLSSHDGDWVLDVERA